MHATKRGTTYGYSLYSIQLSQSATTAWSGVDTKPLLDKWKNRLVIQDTLSADAAASLTYLDQQVANYLSAMTTGWVTKTGKTYSDVPWTINNINNTMAEMMKYHLIGLRLETLARAYVTPNSKYYYTKTDGITLKTTINELLAWLLSLDSSRLANNCGSWWAHDIGFPRSFENTAILLKDNAEVMPADRIAKVVSLVKTMNPSAVTRSSVCGSYTETGANLTNKATILLINALLGKNATDIDTAVSSFAGGLSMANDASFTANGFHRDGSYIDHNYYPYFGNYGKDMFIDIANVAWLTQDTPSDLTQLPSFNNIYTQFTTGIKPLLAYGALEHAFRGRMLTRQGQTQHYIGRQVVGATAVLAEATSNTTLKNQLKSTVKRWVAEEAAGGTDNASYLTGAIPFEARLINALNNDNTITTEATPAISIMLPYGARFIQSSTGTYPYTFVISMFSDSIRTHESGNGQNVNGAWTGMGVTYLYYPKDPTQFDDDYVPTVNYNRFAGLTTDNSLVESVATPGGSGTIAGAVNEYKMVGGTTLDHTIDPNSAGSAVAMMFSNYNTTAQKDRTKTLSGNKAWFALGNKIVALGSNINAPNAGAKKVETIVENLKLNNPTETILTLGKSDNTVSSQAPSLSGLTNSQANTSWAQISTKVNSNAINTGYYFPYKSTLETLTESRTGTWLQQDAGDDTAGDNIQRTKAYISLAIPHNDATLGAVVNDRYAYVLLPNRTAQDTQNFAKASPITILQNDANASAVYDASTGMTGAIVWNNNTNSTQINDATGNALLKSDKNIATVLREGQGWLELSISEPTRSGATVNLEIFRTAADLTVAGNVVNDNEGKVTLSSTANSIKLAINTATAYGKTFTVKIKLATPAMDASKAFASSTTYDGSVSTKPALPASYAFDGVVTTRWSSAYRAGENFGAGGTADNQWVGIDLGYAKTVSQAVLSWEGAYGKDYAIEYSVDNVNWLPAYSVTGNTSAGSKTHNFTPITARYWRVHGTKRGTTYGYSLYSVTFN